jgi:hypothetical protein
LVTEALVVSWFSDAGTFASFRTEGSLDEGTASENGFTPPAAPGRLRLWVVLRDGRGGVGHATYELDVR